MANLFGLFCEVKYRPRADLRRWRGAVFLPFLTRFFSVVPDPLAAPGIECSKTSFAPVGCPPSRHADPVPIVPIGCGYIRDSLQGFSDVLRIGVRIRAGGALMRLPQIAQMF